MLKFIEFAIAVAILLGSLGFAVWVVGIFRIQLAKAEAIDRNSESLNDDDF